MRKFRTMLTIVVLATTSFTIQSCKGKKTENSTNVHQEQAAEQGKEYTSAYVCRMHCKGSGSDTMGECPVCGMPYVKNENYNSDNK